MARKTLKNFSLMELALFDKVKDGRKRKAIAEVLTNIAVKEFIAKRLTDELINADLTLLRKENQQLRKDLIVAAVKSKMITPKPLV